MSDGTSPQIDEFSTLRQEIENRSNAQLTLISLNLTAIGTLGGFVLSEKSDPRLLLLLPILCPSIGMLYLDHALVIQTIGDYIKDVLAVRWEERVRAHERRGVLRFLLFGTPIVLMFLGAPAFALVRLWGILGGVWEWSLWVIGLILVVAFLWFWIAFLLNPLRKPAPPRKDA